MDLYYGGEFILVGLVNKSIHSHEGTNKRTMLLIGLLAISGAAGITGTTIPINWRDYF
jgi:hypothetical protein